jgi:hypothetical protein
MGVDTRIDIGFKLGMGIVGVELSMTVKAAGWLGVTGVCGHHNQGRGSCMGSVCWVEQVDVLG